MIYCNSIALWSVSSQENMKEPAFINGLRSYRICITVVVGGTQNIVDQPHAKIFELNEIRETQKHFSACILFVPDTGNRSLAKNRFWEAHVSLEWACATAVRNAFKLIVVEVPKHQVEVCTSAIHLQLQTHSKERFKRPIKMACLYVGK